MILRPILIALSLAAALCGGAPSDRGGGHGAIRTWVWHYQPELGPHAASTYRDLLDTLPEDVTVFVAAQSANHAAEFRNLLGLDVEPDGRIRFLYTSLGMSGWARDRYVLLQHGFRSRALLPRSASVLDTWRGDLEVPRLLRRTFAGLEVVETNLEFEGGNVLCSPDHVFVGHSVVSESARWFAGSEKAVRFELESAFHRRVVIVGDAHTRPPHDHIDMFLTIVGPRQLLLGDPRLALDGVDHAAEKTDLGRFPRETQLAFVPTYERIATSLRGAGFAVARIPVLHGADDLMLTWNNAVIERRNDRVRAYVPRYGIPKLDRLAYRSWRRVGVDVAPVDTNPLILQGGAVRCLSNTLPATGQGE